MTAQLEDLPLLPGLDLVGRGMYLRPYQPYDLRRVLFRRENYRLSCPRETPQAYRIPEGYDVNDSPPMPADQALNQTMIEESWERFDKQLSIDANQAVSNGVFSINAGTSQATHLRAEEDAYYALRSSFIPLWTVYVSDTSTSTEELETFDVPIPFRYSQRRAYEAFFERFGTHYVRRAWVGGKAMLVFTVLKSSSLSKDDIQAGLKASYGTFGEGELNMRLQESKEKLRNQSQCSVFGCGGDEFKLASLSTLDEARYNEWLTTIRDNPQVIELEVTGIWTLIKDPEKAKALMDAYRAATTFTSISAVFNIDRTIYCVRGRKYFRYDIDRAESEKPQPLLERWPFLADIGFERIDAAFRGDRLKSAQGEDLSRKLHLFHRDEYIRVDVDTDTLDPGYPKPIAEGFPGVTFDRIDAALYTGYDCVYFFAGNKYIRFNTTKHHADEGYPELISKRWVGVTFDRIDATIYWGNGKVYFFREDQHIRYDMLTCRADAGYPKYIIGNYVEDWKFFD